MYILYVWSQFLMSIAILGTLFFSFPLKGWAEARCWRGAWHELSAEDNRSSLNFEASWSGSLTERKSALPGGTERHGGRWCFLFGARVGRKRSNGESVAEKKTWRGWEKRKKAFLSNKWVLPPKISCKTGSERCQSGNVVRRPALADLAGLHRSCRPARCVYHEQHQILFTVDDGKLGKAFLLGAMSPGSHFDALRWISGSRYPAEPAGSGLFNHSALIWLSVHSRCQLWHHHHRNLINFSVSSPSSTEEDKKVLLWTGYKQNMLSEALILQWPLYPCGSALSGFLRTFQKSVSIFQSRKSAMCSGALSHAPDEGKIFFT